MRAARLRSRAQEEHANSTNGPGEIRTSTATAETRKGAPGGAPFLRPAECCLGCLAVLARPDQFSSGQISSDRIRPSCPKPA